MEKTAFNGELGFWDYLAIAFYTKFRPSKLAEVGPVRGTLWALPNGKTFVRISPRLQEVRPLTAAGPLPMPHAMPMAIVEETAPNIGTGLCTSASFELDDEFEATIQKRDADELAAHERGASLPEVVKNLRVLAKSLNPRSCPDLAEMSEVVQDDIQKAAENLVVARDGVDHITPTKKE